MGVRKELTVLGLSGRVRAEEADPAKLREEATAMQRSNYQSLLSRGRKAGLTTRELNSALARRPVSGEEQSPGQPDGNGSVWTINEHAQRVYLETEAEPPQAKAS